MLLVHAINISETIALIILNTFLLLLLRNHLVESIVLILVLGMWNLFIALTVFLAHELPHELLLAYLLLALAYLIEVRILMSL